MMSTKNDPSSVLEFNYDRYHLLVNDNASNLNTVLPSAIIHNSLLKSTSAQPCEIP